MLIARVARTLRDRALIPQGSRVLCACSGGPDSAALLACLTRLAPEFHFTLEAASVDHGLRAESQRDLEIARVQAERLQVRFHALRIRVEPGSSLQARAREQRYAALAELASSVAATRIAVGHTRDDQAETVLSRMFRGAGLRGLAGVQPRRADGVIRPLIDCRRSVVHRFARESFELLADDRSNSDPRFERVRIRSHVVPALEVEDRGLVRHLAQVADDARDCMEVVDTFAEALLDRCSASEKSIEISALASQPSAVRRAALRLWLLRSAGLSLGRAELSQLDFSLRSGRGEVWLAGALSVRASGDGWLRLEPRSGPNS